MREENQRLILSHILMMPSYESKEDRRRAERYLTQLDNAQMQEKIETYCLRKKEEIFK